MSFDNVRFPTLISYGATGGAKFRTEIIQIFSGHERRNKSWSQSRSEYQVAHRIKDQIELDELIAFFRARAGRARGFRFRDWADYKLQSENIALGDGVTTDFQITKTYSSGGISDIRDITKIVTDADSLEIAQNHGTSNVNWSLLVDSVLQDETIEYNVDRDTGVISFNTPPGNNAIITVNGEFDVPARFDTDSMGATIEFLNINNWEGIPIIEVRV